LGERYVSKITTNVQVTIKPVFIRTTFNSFLIQFFTKPNRNENYDQWYDDQYDSKKITMYLLNFQMKNE
jgi:hypothetical protein